MHARSLFRILEAAVAVTTLGGCCFGRSYGPSERGYIVPTDAKHASLARADGSLPSEVCLDLCGTVGSDETLLGCWTATLEMPAKDRPRQLTWEYHHQDETKWLNNSTTLKADQARELEGSDASAELDPSVCLAFHRKEDRVSVRNCQLVTHPPPIARGTPVIECRKRHAGGCDMSFGSGRDTRARQSPLPRRDGTAAWLAHAAAAERTSVRAFAELSAELVKFGAPSSLVRAAGRARRDEISHARIMSRLSGVRSERVRFRKTRPRSLEAFAIENAVEGCVRELFGAAVALHQSRAASARLRNAFVRIARDETRHAALALRTFQWCAGKLDEEARIRVTTAMSEAVAKLTSDWDEQGSAPEIGWPDAATATAIASRLCADVWLGLTKPRAARENDASPE